MQSLLITDVPGAQGPGSAPQPRQFNQIDKIFQSQRTVDLPDSPPVSFSDRLIIKDLFESFCAQATIRKNNSKYTVEWYRRTVGFMLRLYPDLIYLDQWNRMVVEKFLFEEGRFRRKWKVSTFINYYGGIRSFFAWCTKQGFISHNFILEIEKPRKEKNLPKSISKEQAFFLIEAAFHSKYTYKFERYRNRALIGIMIFAGLRIKEVLLLQLADVDFERDQIKVNQAKGNKDRVIPMSPRLKEYLISYLRERNRLKKSHLYFFSSTNRDLPMSYSGVKKINAKLREIVGFKFTNHGLRHTFATLMLEGGCDIYSLSKLMGHSDISTTAIYLSASAHHLEKQICKHPLN